MKLTANGEQLTLNENSSLSIERNSPLFNDETGAFSYPLPVPRRENNKALGHPGRLTRMGDIAPINFELQESGLTLMNGSIDFDTVTELEAGIILQSGMTEFYAKMKDKKLSNIDFGSEPWPYGDTVETNDFREVIVRWNAANANPDSFYAVAPMLINNSDNTGQVMVNPGTGRNGQLTEAISFSNKPEQKGYFCLQFKLNSIIEKLFSDYRIVRNEFKTSPLGSLYVFGNIIVPNLRVTAVIGDGVWIDNSSSNTLEYSSLMPEENVVEFVTKIKQLCCLTIDINERLKVVEIYFNREILSTNSVNSAFNHRELTGWEHPEIKQYNGFMLSYAAQSNEYDSKTVANNEIKASVATFNDIPEVTNLYYDQIIYVTATKRKYKCLNFGTDEKPDYKWTEFARLQPYVDRAGENPVEIGVKIVPSLLAGYTPGAAQSAVYWFYYPYFSELNVNNIDGNMIKVPTAIALHRGFVSADYPGYDPALMLMLSSDEFTEKGEYQFDSCLTPTYLVENYHFAWLNFLSNARNCTKYLELSLWELVTLQWYKRYLVNGVALVLTRVSYEVPYTGTAKIEAYTS